MKGAIFSNTLIEEIARLRNSLESRGVEVSILQSSFTDISQLNSEIISERISDCDFVYYRNGLGDAVRHLYGEVLKNHSVRIFNEVILSDPLISNKVYQSYRAKTAGLTVPRTLVGKKVTFENVANELGTPIICKQAEGIQGAKVWLFNNSVEFNDLPINYSQDVLFQQFIPNNGDYRVFVIGDTVHEIIKRIPQDGNFRANLSLGGDGKKIEDQCLRERLGSMALTVCGALGLEIAGIDFIESLTGDEIYFIEANVNPGWKGLDLVTKKSTSEVLADYFLANIS